MKVRKCRDRVGKSHHPEPGVDSIDALLGQIEPNSIACDKADVLQLAGSCTCDIEQQGRYVYTNNAPPRANRIGELQHGLPGSAAYVHNDIAAAWTESFDRTKTERRKLKVQGVADLGPSLSRKTVCRALQCAEFNHSGKRASSGDDVAFSRIPADA